MANCRRCSFDLSDASIMREPIRTTRPPISEGSSFASTVTLPPNALRRALVTASNCVCLSGCAEVTSAVTSPRRWASSARNASFVACAFDEQLFQAVQVGGGFVEGARFVCQLIDG